MATNSYYICEICIKHCHAGHNIFFSQVEYGFCNCGQEGLRGIRPCQMLNFLHSRKNAPGNYKPSIPPPSYDTAMEK